MGKSEQIRRAPGFGQGILHSKLRHNYEPFERLGTASNMDGQLQTSDSANSSIDFPFFYQQT